MLGSKRARRVAISSTVGGPAAAVEGQSLRLRRVGPTAVVYIENVLVPGRRRPQRIASFMIEPLAAADEAPRSLRDRLGARKGMVAVAVAVAAVLATLHYFKLPAVYESSARLLVRRPVADALANPLRPDAPGGAELVMSLLTDAKSIEAAVRTKELTRLPSLRGQSEPAAMVKFSLAARPLDSAPEIVVATCRGAVAPDCRKILEAVLASRPEFVAEPGAATRQEIAALLTEVERSLRDVQRAEAKLREVAAAAPEGWVGPQSAEHRRQVVEAMEESLADAQRRRADAQARKEAIEAALTEGDRARAMELVRELSAQAAAEPPAAPPARDKDPAATALPGSLESLLAEESKLLVSYGENHPKVREIRARIDAVRRVGSAETIETRLMAEEKVLLETLGPDHPKVQAVRAQLEALRGGKTEVVDGLVRRRPALPAPQAGDPVAAAIEQLIVDVRAQSNRAEELQTRLVQERIEAEKFADYAFQLQQQTEAVSQHRRASDEAVDRLSKAVGQAYVRGTEIVVLAPPATAVMVEPKFSRILAGWLVVGLVAGVGLALWAESAGRIEPQKALASR